LPAYGLRHGKGEALWKGLHVTDGDGVVYLDTDLVGVTPQWVTGLLWPLLTDDGISFVKGCYERPLLLAGQSLPGGGRVTELTARPLLDLLWPQLAGVVQPLGGEYAARRELLEQLPYDAGYAVELGLLLDAVGVIGLDGLAQVYLGLRQHRNQDTEALGRMAAGITAAALQRAGIDLPGGELVQFRTGNGRPQPHEVPLAQEARPPLVSIPEYAARRARAS
ncbi:MAG TPA: glucosyl-3-phosphoglycerate synthase, partial [Mycobacteriales bacterium]|nr:glucosyl-3-phosphoglycerate synthase [Mycobacteriales bacterium]